MDNSTAFQLYRNYANLAREQVAERVGKPVKDALSEGEFVRVWESLPKTERSLWEERFRAGFNQIIQNESSEYASVLSCGKSASLKAA